MRLLELIELKSGDKVVDLGGTSAIWQYVKTPLDITIVNLPGVDARAGSLAPHHQFHFVAGDATALDFEDFQFDLVFSNSVIEHVGGPEKELEFAREVRRLAPAYCVQTPAIWFPLEPHTGVPFWWALPTSIRNSVLKRWKSRLPAWTAMIEGTTVISRETLQGYFPDGGIFTERFWGIPKSYTAIRSRAEQGEKAK